eukprot:7002547-Prymnesium_polylepis.2
MPEAKTATFRMLALLASWEAPRWPSSRDRNVRGCGEACHAPFHSFLELAALTRPLLLCSMRSPAGHLCPPATLRPDRCPKGHFCPEGTPAAIACVAGTFTRSTSLSSKAQCESCPPGSYCSLGASEPEPCPAGRYGEASELASRECTGACLPGFYCLEGSTSGTSAACRRRSAILEHAPL